MIHNTCCLASTQAGCGRPASARPAHTARGGGGRASRGQDPVCGGRGGACRGRGPVRGGRPRVLGRPARSLRPPAAAPSPPSTPPPPHPIQPSTLPLTQERTPAALPPSLQYFSLAASEHYIYGWGGNGYKCIGIGPTHQQVGVGVGGCVGGGGRPRRPRTVAGVWRRRRATRTRWVWVGWVGHLGTPATGAGGAAGGWHQACRQDWGREVMELGFLPESF